MRRTNQDADLRGALLYPETEQETRQQGRRADQKHAEAEEQSAEIGRERLFLKC